MVRVQMVETIILMAVALLLVVYAMRNEKESKPTIALLVASLVAAAIALVTYGTGFQVAIALAFIAIHPWVISVLLGWRLEPKKLLAVVASFFVFLAVSSISASLLFGLDSFEVLVRNLSALGLFVMPVSLSLAGRDHLEKGLLSASIGAGAVIAPTLLGWSYFIGDGFLSFSTWVFLISSFALSLYVTAKMLVDAEFTRKVLRVPEGIEVEEPNEMLRKLTHLGGLFLLVFVGSDLGLSIYSLAAVNLNTMLEINLPLDPIQAPKFTLILVLGALVPSISVLEIMRVKRKLIFYSFYNKSLLRKKERERIGSYFYTISAIFILAVFFSYWVTLYAMTIALLADAASALIGKRYGRHVVLPGRSLEGLTSGFVTVLTLSATFSIPLTASFFIAFSMTIADMITSLDINDNLLFPIAAAVLVTLI